MNSSSSPARQPRFRTLYWRVLFWAVVVHFALFAFILGMSTAYDFPNSIVPAFPSKEIGTARAIVLWLAENRILTSWAMLLTDLAAIRILWSIVHGRVKTKSVLVYLAFTIFAALLKVVPAYLMARTGSINAPSATYVYLPEQFSYAWITALLLAPPAIFLIVGRIVVGWANPLPGLCSACGYDLRASNDRCPECGTPIPVRMDA